MKYAHIQDSSIVKIGPRPKWLIDGDTPEESRPLTDAELATHGWLPIIDEPPEHDATTQWIERQPSEEWTVEADVVRAAYTVHDLDPAKVAEVLARAIDAERDRRIETGFVFAGVKYQSRPEDRENISGAAIAALAAIMNGAQQNDFQWHGEPTDFEWIALDNTTTPMDAQTMFAFGQTAMAHKQKHIFAARSLKDSDPIPADYAENEAYWP